MILILAGVVLFSACFSIGSAFFFMRRYSTEVQATIKPQFDEVKTLVSDVQALLDEAGPQIKRSQSIIAQHGVQPRQIKTAERYMAEDVIEKYPEAKAILGMISPRTAEYFEENPDILLEMAERWGPRLKILMGEAGESGGVRRPHPFLREE